MNKDSCDRTVPSILFAGEAWFDPTGAGIRGQIHDLIERKFAAELRRAPYEWGGILEHRQRQRHWRRQLTGSSGPTSSRRRGRCSYGSTGAGGVTHLGMELFQRMAKQRFAVWPTDWACAAGCGPERRRGLLGRARQNAGRSGGRGNGPRALRRANGLTAVCTGRHG